MLENLESLSQRIRDHDTDELLIAEMNKLVARGIETKDETLRAGAQAALRAAGWQAENEIEAR
jgi:hypothetical protein